MRRNPEAGQFEGVVKRLANLPPFVTAPVALAAYIMLNQISRRQTASPSGAHGPNDIPLHDALFLTLLKPFAIVLQYLVPLVLALSMVLWFIRHFQARGDQHRFKQVASSPLHLALHAMTWQEFERLVGRAFASVGYRVTHTGRAGPDGGIDLVLTRGTEVSLVQCKHWRAQKVGVEKVRELYGLMAERGAANGFVVSTGTYTKDAAQFAFGKNLTLVTGEQLHQLIRTGSFAGSPTDKHIRAFAGFDSSTCPDCGSPLTERVARRGRYIGQTFRGCTRYPECNGIRNPDGTVAS
jgi:restriction system protein